jgi:hypothetical protein
LENNGVNIWLQKQLKPFCKNLEKVPPELFGWLSLALSAGAGVLLYFAQAQLCPIAVLPAAIVLILRLASDSLGELCLPPEQVHSADYLSSSLCARLGDLSMLLGFAFWDSLRIHLVLMAIVSMLLVSYIAEVARSLGTQVASVGLLSQPNRIVLLIFFCIVYLLRPNARLADYSVFEVMFALFIPLASLTLLQRMDAAITQLTSKK